MTCLYERGKRSTNFKEKVMDLQTLQRKAPSIFATQPYGKMSDKYRFIPTIDILTALEKEGFTPFTVKENRVRLEDKKGFARHAIRLRNDTTMKQVGELVPEIVLMNSHDGSSSFQLSAGIYRLVCANGMVVGNDTISTRIRHSGEVGDIIEGVFEVVREMPAVLEQVGVWQGINLEPRQQAALASAASTLRWKDENQIRPADLLRKHRKIDEKTDLWTTFNVIQENIIKGGVRSVGSTGTRSRSRAVASVAEDQRLNKALWVLADQMAKTLH
jgi:hypothetical protein